MSLFSSYIRTLILSLLVLCYSVTKASDSRVLFSVENGDFSAPATSLCSSEDGYVYISTMDGVMKFDGTSFRTYRAVPEDFEVGINNQFVDIRPLSDSHFALLNSSGQVFVFNSQSGSFSLFPESSVNVGDKFRYISSIAVDSLFVLYMYTTKGDVIRLRPGYTEEERIGKNDLYTKYTDTNSKKTSTDAFLHGKVSIKDGNIEVETDPVVSRFFVPSVSSVSKSLLTKNDVSIIAYEDKSIELRSNGRTLFMSSNGSLSETKSIFDEVCGIREESDGTVYVLTNNDIYEFKIANTGKTVSISNFRRYVIGLNDRMTDLRRDSVGRLWIGTDKNGLVLYETEGKHIHTMYDSFKSSYPPSLYRVNSLEIDQNGVLWLGSPDGVTMLDANASRPADIKFFFYSSETTDLRYSHATGLCFDGEKTMYISTFGGGVYSTTTDRFLGEPLEPVSILGTSSLSPITLDVSYIGNGELVILMTDEVAKCDTAGTVSSSFALKGVPNMNSFSFSKQSHSLLIPVSSGYYNICTDSLFRTEYHTRIAFTKMTVNGTDVSDSVTFYDTGKLDKAEKVTLDYTSYSFELCFSDLDFTSKSLRHYEVTLNDASVLSENGICSFVSLPAGKHILKVKSVSNDSNYIIAERILEIKVFPAPWRTWWAYMIYILLAMSILASILYSIHKYMKLRDENDYRIRLDSERLRFFTDVSHEVRTPLTLISAPIEKLSSSESLTDEDKRMLSVANANVVRLRKMMTRLLDFNRLSEHHIEINAASVSLSSLFSSVRESFVSASETKGVSLVFCTQSETDKIVTDSDLIETVLTNLVHNSLKFTHSGGTITVNAEVSKSNSSEGELKVKVADDGSGIPNDAGDIFERYYTNGSVNEDGRGVGLSLVSEIINRFGGTISAKRICNEGGTEILFSIPIGLEAKNSLDSDVVDTDIDVSSAENLSQECRYTIQINEDNSELRHFVAEALSPYYEVIEAENGHIGLSLTKNRLPDLVITDIMMPVCDGLEYCRKVRSSEDVSHIPIVLLTAKTDEHTKMDFARLGVSDYITKPFSIQYLLVRVSAIISEREQLKTKYRSVALSTDKERAARPTSNSDDSDIEKITNAVRKYLSDSDVTIDDIVRESAMSLGVFSSKCKTLLGMTPVALLKEMRLTEAAEKLRTTDMNIQEIALSVGIPDQRYFARIFKQKYGVTPTEYRTTETQY